MDKKNVETKKDSHKKTKKRKTKTSYFRELRIAKGYARALDFANALAKHLNNGKTGKQLCSMVSYWETGNVPSQKNIDVIINLLKLDSGEARGLRLSFGRRKSFRNGAGKKNRKQSISRPIVKKHSTQTPLVKSRKRTGEKRITKDGAAQFSNAIAALTDGMGIEMAKQLLDSLAEIV